MIKTNAMRMLDRAKINYDVREYEFGDDQVPGSHTAAEIGMNPEELFKTIVLTSGPRQYLVCCIPTDHELDLKKVARSAKVKKVELLPLKDLEPLTGYIRGGCSPIGMKKQFETFIDESALHHHEISVSSGQRGAMIIINPQDLKDFIGAIFTDLVQ